MKIWLSTLAVFLACTAQLHAEELRIGVVNTERILRESSPAMRAEAKIKKEFSSREQEIDKLAKQAKALQLALEKEGLKVDEHRAKERELSGINLNLQRLQREFREDLNLRKNEELAIVLDRADKAIRAIAESERYDLILQEAVYHNPKIDLTDKVLQYLASDKADPAAK